MAFRAVRLRRRWRQADVASRARVSVSTVSRLERGQADRLPMAVIDGVARVLEMRIDVVPRWRGGELDRLVNWRHAAMYERVASLLERVGGWELLPEVSFSVYGERGIIDILGWHAATRTLLVIELKTEIVDAQEIVGTLDRKQRLAAGIARERGWQSKRIATWLAVGESMTNRRRVEASAGLFKAAFPTDRGELPTWLRQPVVPVRVLTFVAYAAPAGQRTPVGALRRVRPARNG
ncbi:MAG: helix-turn-helix domain-containing protein [Candidatus Limnocylindrales bacterium]